MPKFNYLPNNESSFPNIDGVNTYKYDNSFDYGRFDYTQMKLIVCSVPWDMGEAHIGNRTISGIGNVVHFGSKAKRDKYFDDIPDTECYRFETKFKELHRDGFIDVPIPYDMCAKHNYLVVEYAKFANDSSPVQYEGNDGLRKWFWFIREVEFLAPNTTRLHIMDDAFQTWIYDIDIEGMVLERGHAPMFAVSADDFLSDPIENNDYLLTEDVNFGEPSQVKHIDAVALNDGTNMYACIATTADPTGTWGAKAGNTWKTPTQTFLANNGVPSTYVFAMKTGDLATFLANADASVPQFKQTVQGVFFASDTLLTLGTSFTFCSTTCYTVSSSRKTLDFVELDKTQFGYDSEYADIAKLYTYPYACIEITDENGTVETVKIEETDGTIAISAMLSLAYPFIKIDANLAGIGGSAVESVTFKNVTSSTFDIAGRWYDTLRSWDVPTFAVIQESSNEYDYSTHFDRIQRVNEYTTAHTNADANADTAKANADDSADTVKANADDSADTMKANADDNADTAVANATATNSANSAQTAYSNAAAAEEARITVWVNDEKTDAHGASGGGINAIIQNTATSQIATNNMQAAISVAGGLSNGAASSASTAVLGGGPVGAALAAGGAIVGAASTYAQTQVANGLVSTQANAQVAVNEITQATSNYATNYNLANQQSLNNNLTTERNALNTTITANLAATTKGNASREQSTVKGNATRDQTTTKANATLTQTTAKANATRNANTAQDGIDNDIAQAALKAPIQFGSFENGGQADTKPIALFAHVVTQTRSAIASAGDEMLRYGYRLDRQWDFDGNWNIGKYFTYWKLRDFWVRNLNVPDMYMDRIRFFLFGGVTVWKDPADIGNVSVYDNFEVGA